MKLSICIPTYNRKSDLVKNLEMLCKYIDELSLSNDVDIVVSDNCSTDGTEVVMEQFGHKDLVKYYRNTENIGAISNIINILSKSEAEFVMLLGDDDFISIEFLERTYKAINDNVDCIVPSYRNILPNGELTKKGRDLGKKSRIIKKGKKNCIINSWRGHQMSGLVVRREPLKLECKRVNLYNWYPQVFWVAYSCLNGNTLHLTEYPVLVTRPPQSSKSWGYGDDGLIGDIFDNFRLLENVSNFDRFRMEMVTLYNQYWRYAMYIKKGIGKFFKCVGLIIKSKNTSKLTKILFPILLLFILGCQAIVLLFSGKLFRTLSTKVDI